MGEDVNAHRVSIAAETVCAEAFCLGYFLNISSKPPPGGRLVAG